MKGDIRVPAVVAEHFDFYLNDGNTYYELWISNEIKLHYKYPFLKLIFVDEAGFPIDTLNLSKASPETIKNLIGVEND